MDNLEISWVFALAINPGRFEDLKTVMADMVEATQKNEVGALNYEWQSVINGSTISTNGRTSAKKSPRESSGSARLVLR